MKMVIKKHIKKEVDHAQKTRNIFRTNGNGALFEESNSMQLITDSQTNTVFFSEYSIACTEEIITNWQPCTMK